MKSKEEFDSNNISNVLKAYELSDLPKQLEGLEVIIDKPIRIEND
jgi:hypothetical protein